MDLSTPREREREREIGRDRGHGNRENRRVRTWTCPCREREGEIGRDRGHGVNGDCLWSSLTHRSARSSTGDCLWVSTFTVSDSKLSLVTVKICDFFFFSPFHCWRVHRVGEAKKKKGHCSDTRL